MPVDAERIRYGDHPSQCCELFRPSGTGPFPVAVLLHGGFWRERYGRDLQWEIAGDLRGRGWVAWNVEYRRMGGRWRLACNVPRRGGGN